MNNLTEEHVQLLNFEGSYMLAYYDKSTDSFDALELNSSLYDEDGNITLPSNIIPLPTENQLIPFSVAVKQYLRENNIIIPYGERAMNYLREIGHYWNFQEFYQDLLLKELNSWFFKKCIPS